MKTKNSLGKSAFKILALGVGLLFILPVVFASFSQASLSNPMAAPEKTVSVAATGPTVAAPPTTEQGVANAPTTGETNLLALLDAKSATYDHINIAHAAGTQQGTGFEQVNTKLQEMYSTVANFLTLIIAFLQRFMWPVLILIGGLMKNDLLFGAGMEERMLAIWVNVRNLVNILFVLVLLGIALINVLGLKNQEWEFKAIMPKFIIALIAVNFSFIGLKVVIDGVNVVSTAIFAMPDVVQQGLGSNTGPDFEQDICTSLYGNPPSVKLPKTEDANSKLTSYCLEKETGKYSLTSSAATLLKKYNSQNFALFMAINFQKIANINKVVGEVQPSLKNLTVSMIFSVVLTILYGSAFIALFCVLLGRLIVLYLVLVLSPLIALTYVLPQKLTQGLTSGDTDLKGMFIKNAIAPIPIALTMTIGFMMMDAMALTRFNTPALLSSTMGFSFLSAGLSTLQQLIVAVATAGFIWKAVFMAMSNTIAKKAVDKIQGVVGGAGKFALKALEYAPIIPVYKPGMTDAEKAKAQFSIGSVMNAIGNVPGRFDQAQRTKTEELEKIMGFGPTSKVYEQVKSGSAKDGLELTMGNRFNNADKQLQKDLGNNLDSSKNRTDALKYLNNVEIDHNGKKIKGQDIIKALKNGELNEKEMEELMQQVRDKNPGTFQLGRQPEEGKAAPAAPGKPGQAAPPPPAQPVPAELTGKDKAVFDVARGAVNKAADEKDPAKTQSTLIEALNNLEKTIADPAKRKAAANQLIDDVRQNGNLSTQQRTDVLAGASRSAPAGTDYNYGASGMGSGAAAAPAAPAPGKPPSGPVTPVIPKVSQFPTGPSVKKGSQVEMNNHVYRATVDNPSPTNSTHWETVS